MFRCVLDDNPRTAVVALHKSLWLAYRTADASLSRAWNGGVRFTGSVYDAAHGPQPLARGETLFETAPGSPFWILDAEQRLRLLSPRWLGYRVEGERSVTLRWRLDLGEGRSVVVEETPEALAGPGSAVRLSRSFRLVGDPPEGSSISVVLPVTGSESPTDPVRMDGALHLRLAPNQSTTFVSSPLSGK